MTLSFPLTWCSVVGLLVGNAALARTAGAEPPNPPQAASPSPTIPTATKSNRWRQLWERRLAGLATDIDLASGGQRLLVSTVPDPDRRTGAPERSLALYTRTGRRLWRTPLASPTRAQALAEDGRMAWVASYQSEVSAWALDAKPRRLWIRAGMCRPLALAGNWPVGCVHDDDGGAGGPLLNLWGSDAATREVDRFLPATRGGRTPLWLRISPDASRGALVLEGGALEVVTLASGASVAARVGREVADLEWLSADHFAVLTTTIVAAPPGARANQPPAGGERGLELWAVTPSGIERRVRLPLPARVSAIETLSNHLLGIYGMDGATETLGMVEARRTDADPTLELRWSVERAARGDTAARMLGRAGRMFLLVGQSELSEFGPESARPVSVLRLDPLRMQFVTAIAIDREARTLALAFEDGKLRVFGRAANASAR